MSYKVLMNWVSSEQRMFGALLTSLLRRASVPHSGNEWSYTAFLSHYKTTSL